MWIRYAVLNGAASEPELMSLSAKEFVGPSRVTLAYIAVYYSFVIYVAYTKFRVKFKHKAKGKKFDR